MAFLASLRAAYSDVTSRASQLKQLATDAKAQMAAGNTTADRIKGILLTCIAAKAANVATAALPNIANYAVTQEGAGYDVATAWSAMNTAIDAVITQILSDMPASGGFILAETWSATGITVRSFTPANTATLQSKLGDLIASIN